MWELFDLGFGVNPPNKVLEKRWADRTIELHYQRMAKIRPNLDSTLTTMQEVQNRSIQHYSKSKKDQLLEDRFTEIERENRILLQKMATIMQKPENAAGFVRFPSTGIKRTLNGPFRKKELRRIAIENKGILERLQSKRSQYSTYDMEIKYLQNKKRVRNLCEFPHILGRSSHRSAGRSIMRREHFNDTDSTTPYLGPAGPVTAIGDDPLIMPSPPRIQSQRAASGIASHPTPIVKGGLPLPPQANTMTHGFDLNSALSPFDDLGGNLPPLHRKKQIRKLKPLDYRVIQLDPNRAVLYKHSFLLDDRWMTVEISRTQKKFFIVGYDVDQRKAHLIDLTDKQSRKLLGECDNSIEQVVGRLGFTSGGKFIIHDWNKIDYPSLARQGSVSAGAGSVSSRKKRRDQSPYIRHSNESEQPRDQSAPPGEPRLPSNPYSEEFERGSHNNEAPIQSFLPAMPSPPLRPPSLPKQEPHIALPALKSPTTPTPPIQEEERPGSDQQSEKEKEQDKQTEQEEKEEEKEEEQDENYEDDYEAQTERKTRDEAKEEPAEEKGEPEGLPEEKAQDSFLGRPSFEEQTQIQLKSPGEETEPPITVNKQSSENTPFEEGVSSIKPNASEASEASGDLAGAVVQHISAITPAPQDDYVSMTDVEGRPSSSPNGPGKPQTAKRDSGGSGIRVKHINEAESSNQPEPSKEHSPVQSNYESPRNLDSAGQKSIEMPEGTPPQYGELSHEELAQIRNFDPDASPEENKKEQQDLLVQSYTDRELPSDLHRESKPPSALPQEQKALHGAAILVEEEDKESPEGGLEEHPTPPGLSMRDSNESGGVKQDIEDKIPSTGHLQSEGNHLIESGGAHEDLDAIPEEEPGDMTPTPLPKKEEVATPQSYLKKEGEDKFQENEREQGQLPMFGGETGNYQEQGEEERYPEDEESAGTPEPLVEESEDGGAEDEEKSLQEGTGGPQDKKEAEI